MAETIVTIPAADLDRLVYVAIAESRNDAETELLAGLADRILQRRPNVTPANLTAAIEEFRAAIAANRPARAAELASNTSLLMSRMLTRSVPAAHLDPAARRGPGLHPGVLPQPSGRGAAASPGRTAGSGVRPVRPGRALPSGDVAAALRPGQGPAGHRCGDRRGPDRAGARRPDHPARRGHARRDQARAAAPVRAGPDPARAAPSWWPGRTWTRCSTPWARR